MKKLGLVGSILFAFSMQIHADIDQHNLVFSKEQGYVYPNGGKQTFTAGTTGSLVAIAIKMRSTGLSYMRLRINSNHSGGVLISLLPEVLDWVIFEFETPMPVFKGSVYSFDIIALDLSSDDSSTSGLIVGFSTNDDYVSGGFIGNNNSVNDDLMFKTYMNDLTGDEDLVEPTTEAVTDKGPESTQAESNDGTEAETSNEVVSTGVTSQAAPASSSYSYTPESGGGGCLFR